MRSTFTSRPFAAKATMKTAQPGHWYPAVNGTLMARMSVYGSSAAG